MMRTLVALLCLIALGCETRQVAPYVAEKPVINIPIGLRESNWGGGSCVHASAVMLLRWQGKNDVASYWRKHYSGGENHSGLTEKLKNQKFVTTNGRNDVEFLEWAIRTRRGTMVTCQEGAHMVVLVHLDSKIAGILDNNDIKKIHYKPREQFLSEWYAAHSWATTTLYAPPPPKLR